MTVKPLTTADQLASLTQMLKSHPNSRVGQSLTDDFGYVFEYGTEPPAQPPPKPSLQQQLQQRIVGEVAGGGGAGGTAAAVGGMILAVTRRGVAGAARAHCFLATVLDKIVGFALVVDVEDLHTLVDEFDVERCRCFRSRPIDTFYQFF